MRLFSLIWLSALTSVSHLWSVSLTFPRPRSRVIYDLRKMWAMGNAGEGILFPSQLAASKNTTSLFKLSTTSPTNARRVQLWSRTKNFLQIFNNGVINGTEKFDAFNRNTVLTIETMSRSIVRIKGEAAAKYVAMNAYGKLYATPHAKGNYECLFRYYHEENNWESFSSYYYGARFNRETGWLLSIRRNGKIKRAKRTVVGEKSTQFLVINYD